MDRQIVTPGQLPLDTDLLNTNKNVMIALGDLMASLFGTSTIAYGLSVSPTTPASLSVNVAPGSIYAVSTVDATAYGSLAADTTDTIVKQGVLLSATQLAMLAPTTAGYSVNYLIEAAFSEVDGIPQLLPFYNSTNPAQPYQGPGGNNQQINTRRQGQVSLVAKAGIAATTGTQVTPSPDAGYIGLAVVTIAYGQTQINAGNITAQTSNVLPYSILQSIQGNALSYGKDVGAVNALVVNLQPAPTALVDGMIVEAQIAVTNTGATTLNLNGTGAKPVIGAAHLALQGGELVANGKAEFMWHAGLNSWVLLGSTGGAQQLGAGSYGSNPSQFDNSTKLATTSFVNSAGFHFPASILQVTGAGNIPLSAVNGFINITAGGNFTLGLPSVASIPIGSTLSFISSNNGTVTIGLNGSDGYGNLSGTTLTIQSGTLLTLIAAGGSTWWVIGGGQVMKILPEFASNFNANGYQKLPSGLIIQWGGATGSGSTAPNATVIYPIAFPNATLQVYGNPTGVASGTYTVLAGNPTKTQASFTASGSGTPGNISFCWFAIGY